MFRITPACAGKSSIFWRFVLLWKDHPRVCGEKNHNNEQNFEGPGSPPRVRGKANLRVCAEWHAGITPACAGKSTSWRISQSARGDHPRVCGEKRQHFIYIEWDQGSPPRVRGKELFQAPSNSGYRITPACAGKSQGGSVSQGGGQDHPRVCGEKSVRSSVAWCTPGSPPRVRGKGSLLFSSCTL